MNNAFSLNFNSFYNFSHVELNKHEQTLLSLGTRFIITPCPLSNKEIEKSTREFFRRLRLRVHFFSDKKTINKIPRFYTPNPNWDPTCSKNYKYNESLEEYITLVYDDISIKMNMIHSKPVFKRNINKDLYKATISLRDNKNIVIRPADKNLGPTVLCRYWYVNKMIAQ